MKTAATEAPRDLAEAETKFIVWKTEYSVGVKKLDNQHMKIIQILNDMYDCQRDKTGALDPESILNDLLTCTRTHFADEEGLLRLVGYPTFTEHKELHDRMAHQTQDLYGDFLKSRDDLSPELLTSLKEWWLDHIRNDDKRYVPYLALFVA